MLGDSRNIDCSANPCVRRSAAYGCAVRKTRVLAILTFAAIAVSSSQVSAKASPAELGCLQRLPTGRKDLPPVHVCGYALRKPARSRSAHFDPAALTSCTSRIRVSLTPVRCCRSATELEEGLQTESLTDTLEGTSYK